MSVLYFTTTRTCFCSGVKWGNGDKKSFEKLSDWLNGGARGTNQRGCDEAFIDLDPLATRFYKKNVYDCTSADVLCIFNLPPLSFSADFMFPINYIQWVLGYLLLQLCWQAFCWIYTRCSPELCEHVCLSEILHFTFFDAIAQVKLSCAECHLSSSTSSRSSIATY